MNEMILIIGLMTLATFLTRGFSFWFLNSRQDSAAITFIGGMLPLMVMPLLVIYALKDTSLTTYPYGIPELSSALLVAGIHLWRGNALLSIGLGTGLYVHFQYLI
jgi:branched-subunit amino acid transport protein AzlD